MRHQTPGPRLRLVLRPGIALGPGKVRLLEDIGRTGSIAAAGAEMGMSYRRAWLLVSELNAIFREPLVVTAKGGSGGGGAWLTALGEDVVHRYRHMETLSNAAVAGDFAELQEQLREAE